MKLVSNREPLLSAYQACASVVPTKHQRPVLESVKLEADDGKARLIATDMEIGVRHDVEGVEVKEPGSVLINAQRLGAILRESSDETLRIETSGNSLVMIHGSRSTFELPTQPVDEFPSVEAFGEDEYATLAAGTLRELIRRTLFACDESNSRYTLGGILLDLSDEATAVGTDGRRLAKMAGPLTTSEGDGSTRTGIVPKRSMKLVENLLGNASDGVDVAMRNNDVLFRTPAATVYARLLEGRFPKWRDVIPEYTDPVQVDLLVGALRSAVRQAAVVLKGEIRALSFAFGDGSLVLASEKSELGTSRVELPISYDGPALKLALDYRFVEDVCKVLDAESMLTVLLESPDSVAMFTVDEYQYVVMPLTSEE